MDRPSDKDSVRHSNKVDRWSTARRGGRCDQLVRDPLVVPLVMVVSGKLVRGRPQVAFSERNDAVEALIFNCTDEPLGICVCLGMSQRTIAVTLRSVAVDACNGAAY